MVGSFAGRAEAGGVDLTLDYPQELADLTLVGDWGRLDQVFGNLVVNALRYTEEGGEIKVSAKKEDGSVVIIVRDSGEGIPEEDLPYVFDRFWKGDRSRSRASGGSGLGLAIARQFVQAHGGEIEAESQVGEGTTFLVKLPLNPG